MLATPSPILMLAEGAAIFELDGAEFLSATHVGVDSGAATIRVHECRRLSCRQLRLRIPAVNLTASSAQASTNSIDSATSSSSRCSLGSSGAADPIVIARSPTGRSSAHTVKVS